jgi:HTH-type transcriptional regulator / antitoxin HipB
MHASGPKSSELAAHIGRVVHHERERSGLRQDELALVAGVSTRVIHQIEHGKPTSRLDSLVSVLDALGLQLAIEEPPSRRSAFDGEKR